MKKKSVLGRILIAACVGFAILFSAAAVGYILFTGPHDLDRYPDPAASPYLLPWPGGVTWLCIQSNRGVVSHRGREEFAYDFKMPEGSPVVAARAGKVIRVEESRDGHGYRWPNNYVVLDHGDGTTGHYLHIRKNGALVDVGDTVAQGDVIAESGHVGNSSMPHLHFHVSNDKNATVPVSFRDVARDRGVPRMFHSYTSGNRPQAPATSADSAPAP
ncbi:MAG: M23 family metallopeptidase [Candidatus Hydrogenedentes bacterium]|nr:M23 family metallopeptidase [Candidatus Hydrogenedentota bacterium]